MTIIRLMGGAHYWLVLILATYCSCYDLCSGNRNCSCTEIGSARWHFRCSHDGYSAFVGMIWNSTPRPFCMLHCDQSVSWYDAEFRPMKLRGEVVKLAVFDCSLPDISFGTTSRKLGLENTFGIQFSSYQKLGRSVTRRHLSGLPKLGVLDLSKNGLTELTSDLLRDVPGLESLSLATNEITSLPREIFGGLRRLSTLYLNDNKIEVLDPMLFRNCTALFKLNVTNNFLTTLDHRLFYGLLNLTYLYLDNNPLATTSNDAFESLKGLKNLHISGCQFSSLPKGLFRRMNSIQELKLCDNRGNLTTLPEQLFNNTTSTFDLYLERNGFARLSEETFRGGIQLHRLVLTGNAFSTLPENIFSELAGLVLLDLSDNGLSDLPDGLFRGLTHLANLSLSHNRITSLSTLLFADLYSLNELDLSFNRITQIHEQIFKNLFNLRIARFSHNSIQFPDDGQYLFQYCVNLEKLFLDHNNFTRLSIKEWDYRVARTLQFVDLSHNRLSDIEVKNKLPESRRFVFDLQHNHVQQILTPIRNLAELVFMLDDNPMNCDCNLVDWIRPMEVVYAGRLTMIPGNATCASPEWMNGTRIADLDWNSFLCRPSQRADEYIHCADECDCWWRPSDWKRVVDCSSRNLTRVRDRIMEFSDHNIPFSDDLALGLYAWHGCPTELRFERNRLTEIPLFNESIYESVRTIFLSFNNFSVVSRIFLPPNLEVLRLDHCNLTRFEPAALDVIMDSTTLEEMNLDGNPWDCHRDTRNALLAIDNKFGRVTKFAGGEHICLDPGRVRSRGKEHQFYISYTRF